MSVIVLLVDEASYFAIIALLLFYRILKSFFYSFHRIYKQISTSFFNTIFNITVLDWVFQDLSRFLCRDPPFASIYTL